MTAAASLPLATPTNPRASPETRFAFALALAVAIINLLAALAMTPSGHLQHVAARVDDSRLASAVAVGPWDLLIAVLLFPLAWGLLRRRAGAWGSALALLVLIAGLDIAHHEHPLEVAIPVIGIAGMILVRRKLVAEPYRDTLGRHLQPPSPESMDRIAVLIRDHGRDTMAPFKLRTDVGHLFSDANDAVLAFRVDNRALLVAGDPVGTEHGSLQVLSKARNLARHAGLRFGVTSASPELRQRLESTMGMRGIYLGCEAIVDVDSFTLEGRPIKKVRQAHRRVLREGYVLRCLPMHELSSADLPALRACRAAARPDEQSFAMAPESLEGPGHQESLVCFAQHEESGEVAGIVVFMPLQQRSLWSLALQLRRPDSPNGVVDALLVHALQQAREAGVAELSLNFAAARRYVHEPAVGFWPNVARRLALLATRWTQIDDLRFHNEKFSPRWEPRHLVVDHVFQLPHLSFATIWQEGQLPRPGAFLSPAWPSGAQASGSPDAAITQPTPPHA